LHLDELTRSAQANVDSLQHRVDDLARQQYMGDHSSDSGNQLNALAPQLAAARHQLDGYKAVQAALRPAGGPNNADPSRNAPRLLGFIDDQGHAAVSIGNPDTATRNAVLAPGTGQDLAAFGAGEGKSEVMFRAALTADPSLTANDVSVTTWMGYDRPMDVPAAAWTDPARGGAGGLDSFVDGMHASHTGGPAIDTVIGHSYGSTLVGAAGSGGHHLAADNVIAVGSPGMLVGHAGDLSLDQGANVYAMTARNDVIGLATGTTLGPDPNAADFGATRRWAAPGPSLDPYGILPSTDAHSSYWDRGNPGLANMGSIIAGLPPVQIVTPHSVVANQ
jgi:hypothetical protein